MSKFRDLLMTMGNAPAPTRRHIQIGDNLKNKTLYFDFPNDIWDNAYFPRMTKNYHYFAISNNVAQNKTETSASNRYFQIYITITKDGNARITVGGYNSSRLWVYDYESGEVLTNMLEVDLTEYADVNALCDNNIVWLDTDNPLYQYIWIEDSTPAPTLRNIEVGDILYGKKIYYEFTDSDFAELSSATIIETQANPERYNAKASISYNGGSWITLLISSANGGIDYLYSNYAGTVQTSPYTVIGDDFAMPVATIEANDPIYKKIFIDPNE